MVQAGLLRNIFGFYIHRLTRTGPLNEFPIIFLRWYEFHGKGSIQDRDTCCSSCILNAYIATMWGGRIKFAAAMLSGVGAIILFFASGAGGVVNTAIPLDFMTHDTYFVVGHFHLMLMGTVSLA